MDKANSAATQSCKQKKAIIISAVKETRARLGQQLEKHQWSCFEALTLRQAICVFNHFVPNLVLLDAGIKPGTALKISQRIRSQPAGRHVPIVLLCNTPEPALMAKAFAAGITDIASKPVNCDLLLHRLPGYLAATSAKQHMQVNQSPRMIGKGSWTWDSKSDAFSCSNSIRGMLENLPKAATLTDYLSYLPPEQQSKVRDAFYLAASSQEPLSVEHQLIISTNDARTILLSAHAKQKQHPERGYITTLSGTLHDISSSPLTIKNSARDPLTGFANGKTFDRLLKEHLKQAQLKSQNLAVISLDIDDFRLRSNTLGKLASRNLLATVAKEIKKTLHKLKRPSLAKKPVIARLGKDEFGLILPAISSAEATSELAEQLLQYLNSPDTNLAGPNRLSASIGISMYPRDTRSHLKLLPFARAARLSAKNNGKNCYQHYRPEMAAQNSLDTLFSRGIGKALKKREFTLLYQPQIQLQNGRVKGVEALLRWRPEKNIEVSPSRFLAAAERQRIMEDIDQWVLQTACADYVQWMQQGHEPENLSVNVSRASFFSEKLADMIEHTLLATKMPARRLLLELDESTLMCDPAVTLRQIEALQQIGCQITLDNFGSGLCSLDLIQRLALTRIKMSRQLTREMDTSITPQPLANSIITLGKNLGTQVVAQGVETRRQLEALQTANCDYAQGFFISKPLSAARLAATLRQRKIPKSHAA